ncbi:hypothetical protein BH11BAC2_BH11BAC2_11030 [soil metagenome]
MLKSLVFILAITISSFAVNAQTDSTMSKSSHSSGAWEDTTMTRQQSDSLRYLNSGARRDNNERYGTDSTRMESDFNNRSKGTNYNSTGNSKLETDSLTKIQDNNFRKKKSKSTPKTKSHIKTKKSILRNTNRKSSIDSTGTKNKILKDSIQ